MTSPTAMDQAFVWLALTHTYTPTTSTNKFLSERNLTQNNWMCELSGESHSKVTCTSANKHSSYLPCLNPTHCFNHSSVLFFAWFDNITELSSKGFRSRFLYGILRLNQCAKYPSIFGGVPISRFFFSPVYSLHDITHGHTNTFW